LARQLYAADNRKTMSNQVIEVQGQGDFIERLTSARPELR